MTERLKASIERHAMRIVLSAVLVVLLAAVSAAFALGQRSVRSEEIPAIAMAARDSVSKLRERAIDTARRDSIQDNAIAELQRWREEDREVTEDVWRWMRCHMQGIPFDVCNRINASPRTRTGDR